MATARTSSSSVRTLSPPSRTRHGLWRIATAFVAPSHRSGGVPPDASFRHDGPTIPYWKPPDPLRRISGPIETQCFAIHRRLGACSSDMEAQHPAFGLLAVPDHKTGFETSRHTPAKRPCRSNSRAAAERRMSRGRLYTGTQCDRQSVRPGASGVFGRPAGYRRCRPRRRRLRAAFQRRQPAPAPAFQPGIAPRGSASGRPERRCQRDYRASGPTRRRFRPARQSSAPRAGWQRSG